MINLIKSVNIELMDIFPVKKIVHDEKVIDKKFALMWIFHSHFGKYELWWIFNEWNVRSQNNKTISTKSNSLHTNHLYYQIKRHNRCVHTVRSSIFSNFFFNKKEGKSKEIQKSSSNNRPLYNHIDLTVLVFDLATTR